MLENTCFICLNEINDDIYHFDELELAKMACNCYKHKSVHIQCFNEYLKKNTENKNNCAVCRSSILNENMLIKAIEKGQTQIVRILLERGHDVNIKDVGGITALMKASFEGHTEIVSLLLEKGADVNAFDHMGISSLMGASYRGHTEIVSLLLEKGADVNAEDITKRTALMFVGKKNMEVASLLVKKGAKRFL